MDKPPDFMPAVVQSPDAPIWEDPALALALCKAIIDNIVAAFVAMDVRGLCVEWNQHAEKTFGWTRQEALGEPVADLIIPPELRALHWAGLKHYAEYGDGPILNRRIEVYARHKDGTTFPCTVTIVPLPWKGQPLFAGFIVDVSHQKEMLAKLKASYEQTAREMVQRIKAETKVEHLEQVLGGGPMPARTEASLAVEKLKEVAERIQNKLGRTQAADDK